MKKLLLVGTVLTVLFGGSAQPPTLDGQPIRRRLLRPQSIAGPASTSGATSEVPGHEEP